VLLTNQAGTALRNALLYSQVQESNRRLQDLDRLKGEFIAIASHELRTPLSIVLGYTMMVRDQTSGDHREYLQRVMDGAQRIKDIIDDMVSLRHLETGKAQLNLQPAVLQTVIRQAVDRMLPVAHAKAQQFNAYLPERPISCMVDREKLLLILGNLISNAVKFTPERGMLAVCADIWNTAAPNATSPLHTGRAIPIILPEQLDAGIWIVVQVRDNGIGIPEPEQDRIFERFYQVASSLTREHGGTGLGLAIVQELVMLLQGAVWVDSSKTQGSVFSFAIPYVPMHSVEANS
jgi:signal transduction histidine kinase